MAAVVGDGFGVLPVNEAKAARRRQIESYLFERSLQMALQDEADARKALELARAKAEESEALLAKCRAEEVEARADLQAKRAELEVQRVRRVQARRRGKTSAMWR